ncbi:tRNA (adenine22-N1)-methyltransferase [Aneurinibacillus soli]|uniref:tRNA (Adenine(22)-N(1))-methyltransferase n=1 Tax=Aneurinibacillus soli TaxID=1500254 RepID=A0A0U5B954_9BACL|nr:class I SAM-dependent methyltransferase [Aneurinibacillus soli]PYE60323.1 tRNA (adenine22-N1)-methyltransferase [Aneurinibacillus soli]BAU27277.1 tRNA (adenine(22)-N(1))-methyltransferase [Aneurinibacillus soli]
MIEISQRLQRIGDRVEHGSRVADIGSDHAYLPTYLIQQGIAASCIAGEVNKGPWQSAARQIQSAGLTDRIEARLGDGLAVLEPGEVDVVCISGMGGSLIASILGAGEAKLVGVRQLILQPNVAAPLVRRWLMEHGWQLVAEDILEEDGIIYEILEARPGDPMLPYEDSTRTPADLVEIGPHLWHKKSPVLHKKWSLECAKLRMVLDQMTKAKSAEAESRREEMEKRLNWMEEMLACMQTDSV